MSVTETLPDHDELDVQLRDAGATASAAEVHGILTGTLCAPTGAENAWHGLVFDANATPGTPLDERLTGLLAHTRAMLVDADFGFVPLLPGEPRSLAQQLEGFTDWCRGFLLGFSAGAARVARTLSPEAQEFLEDMVRMSDAELEAQGDDEEGEARALAELTEYLRAGVQLLHDERDAGRAIH